jgi:Flp pilus assembly protein TadG
MSRRRRSPKDRGAAAVEMAIVLPLLLLLLFGIIDLGRLLYTQVELSSGAREGARIAAINHPSAAGLPADVTTRVRASVSLDPSSPVTASINSLCPAAPVATDLATVTASTTFHWITPIGAIGGMFGGGSVGADMTVSGKGTMRCGG